MSPRPPLPVLLLTVLGFCVLYAPQPLLPVLAGEFQRTAADASLLITVTLFPLAVAPLLYGYLLEGLPTRHMMTAATGVLFFCQAGMAWAHQWWELVVLRTVEGLALPALFTSLVTFVATSAPRSQLRQVLAWYVAAMILGGFAGRAVTGLVASAGNWRVALGVWVPPLLLMAVAAARLPDGGRTHFTHLTPRIFREVLAEPGLARAYLAILCIFFVFAGLLNLLPFRLSALDPSITSTGIGLAYAGYLSGIAVSLGAQRIRDRLRTEPRTLALGIGLYALGLTLLALPSVPGTYVAMFAFCGGMFLVHTRLAGQVNHLSERHRGVVNGIYIAAYYLGGSLGSWLPALVYRRGGWDLFLGALGLVLALGAWNLRRFLAESTTT